MKSFLLILSLLLAVFGLSPNYKIPSYYGSFEQDFLQRDLVYASNLSSFYWKGSIDYDSQNSFYWITRKEVHQIYRISPEGLFQEKAGVYNKPGYNDGNLATSLFNGPSGICFFKKNLYDAFKAKYQKIILLSSTNVSCLNVNSQNYTTCELPLPSNFQNSSTLSETDDYIPDNVAINQIKEIYLIPDNVTPPDTDAYSDAVLIVSDTDNHCIRQVQLRTQIVSTLAGKCGTPGFRDGPSEINRLNKPTKIGVDQQGIIFFYDSGNNYIRMLDIDGNLYTLLKGSCREDTRKPVIQIDENYYQKPIICYKSWKKTDGEPDKHIYVDNISSICKRHYGLCENSVISP